MSQSLVHNYLHLIFSTKNRKPLIQGPVESELYHYLKGICNNMECYASKVGGHLDHVHISCSLSKKIALVDLLEILKSSSSKWIKKKGKDFESFYWQAGYGAFSVSPLDLEKVDAYIENQHEHHKHMSFQDEYRAFLKKYNVVYDERYVWD